MNRAKEIKKRKEREEREEKAKEDLELSGRSLVDLSKAIRTLDRFNIDQLQIDLKYTSGNLDWQAIAKASW